MSCVDIAGAEIDERGRRTLAARFLPCASFRRIFLAATEGRDSPELPAAGHFSPPPRLQHSLRSRLVARLLSARRTVLGATMPNACSVSTAVECAVAS